MVFNTNDTAISNSRFLTVPIKSLGLMAVIIAALFYILSAVGHAYYPISLISIIVMGLSALWLTIINPRWGLWLLLIELVIGSQGHLLELRLFDVIISLRQILFMAVILGWLIYKIRHQEKIINIPRIWWQPLGLLVVMVGINMLTGWWRYGPAAMFYDANGYWYLLLTPLMFDVIKASDWQNVGRVVSGGQLVLMTLTLILVVMFAWNISEVASMYKWVRDVRLGEITFVLGRYFRPFLQSHFFTLLLALGSLAAWLLSSYWSKKWLIVVMIFSSTVVVTSLSRSFWAGAIVGLIVLGAVFKKYYGWSWWRLGKLYGAIILALVAEVVFLQVITGNFPTPAFNNRLTNFLVEPASVSRLAQLKPLWQGIKEHWLTGSGFGRQLTYVSADPRLSARGFVSTAAFELGWLDTWLDIGLLGLIALGWWLWLIISTAWRLANTHSGAIIVVLMVAIITVHFFSPYLNHPLGLAALIFLTALLPKALPSKIY